MNATTAQSEPLPAFPIRTIRFGMALMIALLVGSTVLTWQMESEIRESMDSQVEVLTAAQKVDHYGTVLDLSIRAVVTSGDPSAAARCGPAASVESWLKEADKALYEAKGAGRNLVMTSEALAA